MIEVTLPLPPTANNMFFNLKNGGRAKTTQYKDWLRIAKAEMEVAYLRHRKPVYGDKQSMALTVIVGANYRRDITNCVKAVEDALCAFLPIPDDRYNDRVLIERDLTIEGHVKATIAPLVCGEKADNISPASGGNEITGGSA